MAGAIVQVVGPGGAATAASSIVSSSITVSAGNTLWVIAISDDTTITSISDSWSSGANTYTERGSVIEAAIPRRLHHATCQIATGGTGTVTVNLGASVSNRQVWLVEISGTAGGYLNQGTATDTGNNPTTQASATNVSQPLFAVAAIVDYQGGTPTVNTINGAAATNGGTLAAGGQLGGLIEYRAGLTTTGTNTADFGNASLDRTCTVFLLLSEASLAPTIDTQPTDQTAFVGGSVTFTSSATASAGSLTWAWQDNSGGSFANISTGSASPAPLSVGPVTAAMNGRRYRIQWTDSNGTITSSEATLFVRSQISDSRLNKVRAVGSRSGLFLLDPKNWGGPSLIVEKWFAPELAPSSGGSTNVNVNDSATGSDAASVAAALTSADSGAGADTAGIAATLAGQTDSGTGTDTATPAPAIAGADSGAGTDTVTFAPAIAGTDSGAGADTAGIAATLAGQTDSGTGTDAAAIAPAIAGADSGAGSDSVTPGPAINGTDTSAGAEQAAVNAAAGISDSAAGTDTAAAAVALSPADSAAGTDTAAAAVALSPADSSTGTDTAALAVAVGLADTGTGADAPALSVNIDLTDSATGTDQVSVAENATPINVSDSGAGSDTVGVAADIDGADAGIGGDTGTVAASVALSDTAAGTDSVSVDTSGTQQVGVSDSGSGSDSVSVEKTEGLDLTLIGRNVRFKPLKKPRQPEAPAEPRKPAPSPLIKALVERAKPRSTGVGEVTVAPAPVAPVVIDLPEVRVVATPTPAPKAPPPPPPPPENPVPLPTAVTPAPKPPERPKPIAVEMVSVPKAAWDALTVDVERFALHIAALEAQLADTKGQLAKARRAANQAQAQLLALQLLEE